jgi:hypothetical protein
MTPDMPTEEVKRINPFDWDTEFADIMKARGFDAVIGNPPYVRQESLKEQKEYYQSRYAVYQGTADLYAYFIEKGISLLRPGGIFSYIVANKWMRANYGKPLRKFLLTKQIEEIVDFGDLPVFKTATTYPCILRVSNNKPVKEFCVSKVETLDFPSLDAYVQEHRHPMDQSTLTEGGWTLGDKRTEQLLKKLQSVGRPLEEYVMGEIYRGITTGFNEAFVIDEKIRAKLINDDPNSAEIIKPFLIGRNVKRYEPPNNLEKFLIFTRHGIDIQKYSAILNYLKQFKEKLMPKPENWTGDHWLGRKPGNYKWYEIQDKIDYYLDFDKPKIVIPQIVKRASYTFDKEGFFTNDKTSIIPKDDLYLLGLLNSKLLDFIMCSISSTKQGGYYEYKPMYVSKLPIYTPDFDTLADKTRHDKMVALVTQMLDLNKRLQDARLEQEKTQVSRQIAATDGAIDKLVYELYGLTEEEIAVVEGT